MTEWYESHEVLVNVAFHAHDRGDLVTAADVLSFFEKPWHYPELHEAMLATESD